MSVTNKNTYGPVGNIGYRDPRTGQNYAHAVEPGLRALPPRPVHWSPGAVAGRRWVYGTVGALNVIALFFVQRNLAAWDDLIAHGTVTSATITEKTIHNGKSTSYHFGVQFHTDAGTRTGETTVSASEYDDTPVGGTRPLTYLPGTSGAIWQWGRATPARRAAVLSGSALGFAIGFAYVGLLAGLIEYGTFRQRRLLRDGIAVSGRAMSGKTESTRNGTVYTIEYGYSTTEASAITARAGVTKAQYGQYTTGNPYFTVLYNAAKPKDSMPYPVITAATLGE